MCYEALTFRYKAKGFFALNKDKMSKAVKKSSKPSVCDV